MPANYALGTIGYDTTFELNEFNEPKIRSEMETLKNVIMFILFAKPGQYPSLPQIGMDIQNVLYSFYDELDVEELKQKLIEQCSMLGGYLNQGTVDIRKTKYKSQPSLMIHIQGTETYPDGYKKDMVGNSEKYLIGITYDEMNNMIYNINHSTGII